MTEEFILFLHSVGQMLIFLFFSNTTDFSGQAEQFVIKR